MLGLPKGNLSLKCAANLVVLCLFMHLEMTAFAQEQPKRPRITGIDHVTIYVSDLNKSLQFYSDYLGFSTTCPQYAGADKCFLVGPASQRILLKRAPIQTKLPRRATSWLAEVGFATDDITQMRAYLLAHHLSPGGIQKSPDGTRWFRVHDPEGNPIAFVERSPSKEEIVAGPKQISTHLIHAGFVVKDMAVENRFYVDLLGFRLYWYGGFKDNGVDWYEIQVPDGPDWIEYMLNIPANADHKDLGIQNHFSLGVKDVHAAAARLRTQGLKTFDGPEIGRDGKDSLDAYDPDGTRVEIMNLTPSQDPCCHSYTAAHPTP